MILFQQNKLIKNTGYMLMERNANIIKDLNGNKIVLISDVIFKGKNLWIGMMQGFILSHI